MKKMSALALWLTLSSSLFAAPAPQTSSSTTSKSTTSKKRTARTTPAAASQSAKLDRLEQAVQAQQQQIQELRQELQTRDQAVQQLQQRWDQSQSAAAQAASKADAAASAASQQQQTVTDLKNDVNDLKQNSTSAALSLQETQKNIQSSLESPLALHYKGITITPGGFLAAETVWRQRAEAADINTALNAIPFSGATQAKMSEFYGSGRQSRITMLGEGKLKNLKYSGYYEADFLSAGVTSNNNQSNSYTLRQRQLWGQAALESGFNFTGGQMWSLVTETRKGLDNRSEALPMTIDPQYTVGFSWARQYGFRVTKNFANKMWLGFSIENPQTTFTAHGNAANFVIGSLGNSGGLYNAFNANYSFNLAPDFIVKAAFEPGFGHYEVFGVLSSFRDRIFPCATAAAAATCLGVKGPSAAGANNDSLVGGGVGANARGSLFHKHVDLGAHALGGRGVGRYGTAGLSDLTVRPDGVLSLIRSYQALGTVEWHSPKWDVYLNGGGEYAGKSWFLSAPGKAVGYGAPFFANTGCATEIIPGTTVNGFTPGALANCTGDTRIILEGTFGIWYKPYNGPKGRLQFGPQYSYLTRTAWAGTGGQPKAIDNMIFTSFRYYLP
jgi:TolA-binding protein